MADADIDVLHHDDALVVIVKPTGMLAVPGRGADKHDCAAARVQQRFADALVVHRLDQATSGLLVFARGATVQRRLSHAFAQREVRKRYVAVVDGCVTADEGVIDAPLAADWPNRPRQIVDATRGRPAQTRFRVLERGRDNTRVALEPITGRSHQLRVHLASIGHPIVGDALYGRAAPVDPASRLLLHASGLAFAHPLSGAALRFDSVPPF